MAINFKAPAGFSTCVIISDSGTVSGGPTDSVAILPKVAGDPYAAALWINSTKGALVVPVMTTAQRVALTTAGTSVTTNGSIVYDSTLTQFFFYQNDAWIASVPSVVGPGVATDNAVARFDGTTGALLQNSTVIIADTTGNISGTNAVTIGTASTTAGTVVLLNGTNANTLTVQPGVTSASYSLTLPTAVPTIANTPVVSSTAGVLSFPTTSPIYQTGTINATAFKAASVTAIPIISAAGANTLIRVHAFSLELVFVSAAFAVGGAVLLQYDNTAAGLGTAVTSDVAAASFFAVASSSYNFVSAASAALNTTMVNKGVFLANKTAPFITGDSTFNYYIWYSIVPTT